MSYRQSPPAYRVVLSLFRTFPPVGNAPAQTFPDRDCSSREFWTAHICPRAALRKSTITQTPAAARPHFRLVPERKIYGTESSSTAHSEQIYKPAETRFHPYSQKRWISPDAHGYRPDKNVRCKIQPEWLPTREKPQTTLAMPYPGFCVSQLYSDIALRPHSGLACVPDQLIRTGNQRNQTAVLVREA